MFIWVMSVATFCKGLSAVKSLLITLDTVLPTSPLYDLYLTLRTSHLSPNSSMSLLTVLWLILLQLQQEIEIHMHFMY